MQATESQTLLWTVPEFPYQVTLPANVLNEIRAAVVEAFYAAPRGGVEIGGVFFGCVQEDRLQIEAYRQVTCQYSSGPSFKLSPVDKLGLTNILNLPDSDPDLAGLVALGWYHSHHRSNIFLSPEDLQVHGEFFPKSCQIAMVLRPAHLQPTRAGFFFRDVTGAIKSDAPLQEFILEPPDFGLTLLEAKAGEPVQRTPSPPAVPAEPNTPGDPPESPVASPQTRLAVLAAISRAAKIQAESASTNHDDPPQTPAPLPQNGPVVSATPSPPAPSAKKQTAEVSPSIPRPRYPYYMTLQRLNARDKPSREGGKTSWFKPNLFSGGWFKNRKEAAATDFTAEEDPTANGAAFPFEPEEPPTRNLDLGDGEPEIKTPVVNTPPKKPIPKPESKSDEKRETAVKTSPKPEIAIAPVVNAPPKKPTPKPEPKPDEETVVSAVPLKKAEVKSSPKSEISIAPVVDTPPKKPTVVSALPVRQAEIKTSPKSEVGTAPVVETPPKKPAPKPESKPDEETVVSAVPLRQAEIKTSPKSEVGMAPVPAAKVTARKQDIGQERKSKSESKASPKSEIGIAPVADAAPQDMPSAAPKLPAPEPESKPDEEAVVSAIPVEETEPAVDQPPETATTGGLVSADAAADKTPPHSLPAVVETPRAEEKPAAIQFPRSPFSEVEPHGPQPIPPANRRERLPGISYKTLFEPAVKPKPVAPGKQGSRWLRLLQRPKPSPDSRPAGRVAGDGLIAFYWEGDIPRARRVRDIGSDGAYIETNFSWPCDTLLALTIQIDSNEEPENVRPDAIVVHARIVKRSPDGMGVEFLFPDPSDQGLFLQFLTRWKPGYDTAAEYQK